MTIKSHFECVKLLREAQETEFDNREMSREADLFLNKRDGQWEPQVLTTFKNRPRYTFDECNPIIDGIMGDIENQDFAIQIDPAGGGGTKAIARAYEGIIRTIERLSKPQARFIYNQAARVMIGTGFDAWRVVTAYRDDDSFQQDLLLKHIPNAQDSVWFDPNAQLPTQSDSKFAWLTTSMTLLAYKRRWPDGSGMSVNQNLRQWAWSYKKPDEVIIGECLYRKTRYRELVLMTNGNIFEVNDDFLRVKDELKEQGIEVHNTKKRPYDVIFQRLFDGHDWISAAQETVFSYIPVVPVFGNFRISENKVIYWGIVEKLMDAQRVINYSESRKIEEGALAPKGKVWMTKEQAQSASVKKTLKTLNTNNDPVQFYDHVDGQLPPSHIGSPPSNPSMMETTQTAQNFVQRTTGRYDESRGTAPPRRSGIAIEKLQVKSDAPNVKWYASLEIAIAHTAEILVKAIPKVYDTQQVMTITKEDGSTDELTIFHKVRDRQTGKIVTLNDLSVGKYSVSCKAGPAFQTRQAETVAAITDYAQIDQTILQLGGDVLLNNINAPGMHQIAQRKRRQMVMSGMIPPDQMTEEETAELQRQQGDDNMSPIDRANLMIAQAEMTKAQNQTQETQYKANLEQTKLKIKQIELSMKQQDSNSKKMLDAMKQLTDQIRTQAEVLKLIREASGLEVMMTPSLGRAFEGQSLQLVDSIKTQ